MKKQIVIIHGGKTFKTYQQYIDSLKNREVSIDKFKILKEWRDSLEKELGIDFEVFVPRMPNGNNAVYEEWKIWFERMNTFLNDNITFIGHSLGGTFLVKYLSENIFNKKIKAILLVAAPFADLDNEISLCSFTLSKSLNKFIDQVKIVYLIHSEDDPVVPFEQVDKYKIFLPNSKIITFTNKQHFSQEFFPEIVELIRKI